MRVENAARRASISGRCWSGASRCAAPTPDLVQIEVKRRVRPPPDTPPKFLPRLLSISAERATTQSCWSSSRPTARRVEFNDVSGAGIVGHKTIRIFEGNIIYGVLHSRAIGELRAADPIEAERRSHHAHDHRRSARVARRRQLRRRPRQATVDRQAAGAVPRRPARRAAGAVHATSTGRGKAEVHNFDLRAFGAGDALGIVTRHARPRRRDERLPRARPAAWSRASAPACSTWSSRATTRTAWSMPRTTRSRIAPPAATSTAPGTIEAVDNGPKLVLAGRWRELRWPLAARFTAETPQLFSSPAGQLPARRCLALCAHGQRRPVRAAARPDDRSRCAARLHKDHLQIDELDLGAFGGQALLAGNARWSPERELGARRRRQGIQSRRSCGPASTARSTSS